MINHHNHPCHLIKNYFFVLIIYVMYAKLKSTNKISIDISLKIIFLFNHQCYLCKIGGDQQNSKGYKIEG